MIAFLEGTVAYTELDQIIVNVGGVGYRVYVTTPFACRLQEGEHVRVHTHQHVREDAIVLYGFATHEERELFVRLQSVSGVGPKAALSIIGAGSLPMVCAAIQGEDVQFLMKVPGIGKKTAQRLIIDLKDKLDDIHRHEPDYHPHSRDNNSPSLSGEGELFAALVALGYTEKEAQGAVRSLAHEIEQGVPVESLIKLALRVLART
jgi:Holliday junction DNA helicase RuvA